MGKYLTPAQYLRADDGLVSAPNLPVATINRYITRAEASVDAYVGFDQRYGGFEPHTTWFQAKWDNATLKTRVPNWPVPVRVAKRYRIQISMLGNGAATNQGFFANIQVGDVAYNNRDNYIEIVPLQAVLYSMLPVIVELGMNPPVVQIDVEQGYYFDSLGEVLDDSGDHTTYYAQRGQWALTYDLQATIQPFLQYVVAKAGSSPDTNGNAFTPNPGSLPYIIYKNGAAQTTGFSVDAVNGAVTFTTPNLSSDIITLDYTYQIPDPVHEAVIAQTTYLLAQRELTRQGMEGLDVVQNAQQVLTRHRRGGSGSGALDESAMDPTAMQLLQPYVQWVVA